MPVDLSQEDLDRIDRVIGARRKIKRGETLYHNGEKFSNLYAIRTGFFKTCITSEDGRDQVTGFQMAGEVIGLNRARPPHLRRDRAGRCRDLCYAIRSN